MLLLSAGLCVSVTKWVTDRQELRAVLAANQTVRKTLGEMTIAIAEKDKDIDRLSVSPCGSPTQRAARP
jgi:hypothetical protein